MFHLYERIYLEVDSMKTDQHDFYMASEKHSRHYVKEEVQFGPDLHEIYEDDAKFYREDFTELMIDLMANGINSKRLIYVSVPMYLKLVGKWQRAVFPQAKAENIQKLMNFAALNLHERGITMPSKAELLKIFTAESKEPVDEKLKAAIQKNKDDLSLEYRLLDYRAGARTNRVIDKIRLFTHRSTEDLVKEIQRNLVSIFFTKTLQEKYGYKAHDHLGEMNLLSKIPGFHLITDRRTVARLDSLSASHIGKLVEDIALYMGSHAGYGDAQEKAERTKLMIISKTNPMNDDKATDAFIDMVAQSNEHSDYIDWADADKINVHLIYYIVSLDKSDCLDYRIQ